MAFSNLPDSPDSLSLGGMTLPHFAIERVTDAELGAG